MNKKQFENEMKNVINYALMNYQIKNKKISDKLYEIGGKYSDLFFELSNYSSEETQTKISDIATLIDELINYIYKLDSENKEKALFAIYYVISFFDNSFRLLIDQFVNTIRKEFNNEISIKEELNNDI